MLSLDELVEALKAERTVLFLGAGASVPSGAPTGVQLARHLQQTLAKGESISDDLMELSGILERRYGREPLVHEVREKLKNLQPTGGLLAIPEYNWARIYTTNFDRLIESAYKRCNKRLVVIRSNYDYGKSDSISDVELLKIHGCVSQDIVDGSKSRLVLSEQDYDEYSDYREALFKRLEFDLVSKDILFIGYSLRDPHLRRDVKDAARINRARGATGRIFVLIYQRDDDRAGLLENQGLRVAYGGIDDFMNAMASKSPSKLSIVTESGNALLSPTLRSVTFDVSEMEKREPNVAALFNGSAATYADIAHGFTFERAIEEIARQHFLSGKDSVSIIGVGGVGKTTAARRIAISMMRDGLLVWEHNGHFPLRANEWISVAAELSKQSRRGLLVVDDSPRFQADINNIVDGIAPMDPPGLQVLTTAEKSAWLPRKKSPRIFSRGAIINLYLLELSDIRRMVSLLADKPEIRRLVGMSFSTLSSKAQIERLRSRCSADMYVSLKHVFGSEALDTIILREFSSLRDDLKDVYRAVAALEAAGARIHRQLIIRLLGIQADEISGILSLLEGIVDEYDIKPSDGLYGWRTRHEVIAQTLTRYKYSDQTEFIKLLNDVVDELNPAVHLERDTIVHLCNAELGIKRISNAVERMHIYRKLIAKAPNERVPRHRLVRELMDTGAFDDAETEIRLAVDVVGPDSPLQRYRARLYLERAKNTAGLMVEDRRVLIEEAHRIAEDSVRRFPDDKYAYYVFEDIGWAAYESSSDGKYLDEAIDRLRVGYERTLDPDLEERLRRLRGRWLPIKS
ncbi:SIR2 family protein [Sorangium sp. So ce185]|uniref:SIR2 family protein n=1 Tax=Sorangium sp. So ce185 TaxID=3133287 RepID=UPI003F5F6F87